MNTTRDTRILIKVRGRLSTWLEAAFAGMTSVRGTGSTELVGEICQRYHPDNQQGGLIDMSRTIVFLHGGWVTPACWEPFLSFFEARGYRCLAPAWPGKDRSVDAIRADPSPLAGLGISEIVEHYARIVPPIAMWCRV